MWKPVASGACTCRTKVVELTLGVKNLPDSDPHGRTWYAKANYKFK